MDAKDLLVKYREERKQHLNQARQLEALIRRLESDLGEPAETEGVAASYSVQLSYPAIHLYFPLFLVFFLVFSISDLRLG